MEKKKLVDQERSGATKRAIIGGRDIYIYIIYIHISLRRLGVSQLAGDVHGRTLRVHSAKTVSKSFACAEFTVASQELPRIFGSVLVEPFGSYGRAQRALRRA